MSAYDDLKFAPMLITDVFDTMKASSAWFDKNKLRRGAGSYPYVSRSGLSNGFEAAVRHQGVKPNTGNAVTIGVDTQTVFYQPVSFYTSVKIQVLRHELLNEASGLVLVSLLRSQMQKFAWGNGASLVRLAATRIMVPVTTDESGDQIVDWDGMTRLGEELMAQAITHTWNTCTSEDADADANLPELRFAPMFITDVFKTIKSSSAWYDKTKLRQGEGVFPFVSRTKASNGTDGFTALQEKSPELGGAVTIGLDTQTIAYQPVPFYTSQNIQVLRHPSLDANNALALVSCLRRQMGKFSWGGNGATLGRLKATRIMVPVTIDDSGDQAVDWEGMTLYGRILRARAEREAKAAIGNRRTNLELMSKPVVG